MDAIATIDDYASLIRAFRLALAHRGLEPSSEAGDVGAGIFAPTGPRHLAPGILGGVLAATGTKLLLVEDPEAWARVERRLREAELGPSGVQAPVTRSSLARAAAAHAAGRAP